MSFSLKISAASRRQLVVGFEKKVKKKHNKKLNKLKTEFKEIMEEEIRQNDLIDTGNLLRSIKTTKTGNKIVITTSEAGKWVKIGTKLGKIDNRVTLIVHFLRLLRKNMNKLYSKA